ncbi:MAG: IS1634 family transposase [Myxococcota bacterium]
MIPVAMPTNDFDSLDVLARPVAHLPFVRRVIDDLAIVDVIEDHCPEHALNRVSDAECVVALVLNVLCGRPALYRMDEWLGKLDVAVLFGEGADASAFNDTRLGLALDHVDAAGTDTVLSELARRYLEQDTDAFTLHHDTTSVSLYGAYEQAPGEGVPVPAKGKSKDRKPDLEQLIYGLSLHGSQAIPLVATVMDGNTSDTAAARDHLRRVVELLPDEREVTFVGDSKTVDKQTIGRLLREGLHVISLVPKTFKVRQGVIDAAFDRVADTAEWPLLAETKPRRKADPAKQYRGMSFERPLKVLLETADGEHGVASREPMRFLVVASDSLREQFDNKLHKTLEREATAVDKKLKPLNAKGFSCEEDARKAAATLPGLAPLHQVTATLTSEPERVKRAKAGRPRKDEVVETRTVWRLEVTLEVDDERVEAARRRAGCFVLVSDWTEELWSDEELLAEYRQQHLIEGHTGFRWLKGPAAVAPVFLKTPHRIRAMGLVLILALMVRNSIQATMRRQLAERNETLPHPFTKKPESKLTTEMAFEHFGGLLTQVVTLGEHTRRMPVRLSDPARHLLDLFGMDESIFSPRLRVDGKWENAPPETPGM